MFGLQAFVGVVDGHIMNEAITCVVTPSLQAIINAQLALSLALFILGLYLCIINAKPPKPPKKDDNDIPPIFPAF